MYKFPKIISRVSNKKINTIVFDIYETIIFPKKNFRPAPVQAFIDTFNYYGYFSCSSSILYNLMEDNFTDIVNKHMGMGKKDHLKTILNEQYMSYYKNQLKDYNITINMMYKKFNQIQTEILENPNYVELHPQFFEIEEYLKSKGIKNICFTTGFNKVQTLTIFSKIPSFNLNNYKLITTDDVKNPRPNAEGIHKIMKECNISNNNIIKVGDTIMDILEGKNADVLTCGVLSGSTSKEKLISVDADYIINDLTYLKTII
jgi:phosphoglycolate phosphatase-like HAD superfamily hydrolase